MKTWKNKINVPLHGICTVKEANDKECADKIAPISHGFVNLYKGNKWIAFCGSQYAKEHIVKHKMKPKQRQKDGRKYMLVGHVGIFGPELLWGDTINDFRACDLIDVSNGNALLLVSKDGNVVRIKCNGTKWYN